MLKYNIEEANIKELCMEVHLSGSLKIKPGVKLLFDKNSPTVTPQDRPATYPAGNSQFRQ